ncbi:MAG: TIM barrel protein [Acidimicrobiaceae bacterium]|nr:TIM barrel protein [Acidimicrobiaceae bacterium]MYJ41801.1 TIM barrel protein [Acidimicrobiaceae bacterium]
MTAAVGTALLDRVATAPISWGVCEVPGWGYQLPVDRVLAEMAAAGFTHAELGSFGYLPTEPAALRSTLDRHGLGLLGGFVPLVLHDRDRADETRAAAHRWTEFIGGAGGGFFVTCAVSHPDHWRRQPLTDHQWAVLCDSLAEVDALADSHGLKQVFHSHFGSVVETDAELARVLEGSEVSLVLDTAHLTLGGTDVLELLDRYARRVGLVRLKDVDPALGTRLTAGELTLMQAVQRGLFPPLGRGEVPITEIVTRLEESGRDLWYVLEQDAAIAEGDLSAVAWLRRNADLSLDFLRGLVPARAAPHRGGPGSGAGRDLHHPQSQPRRSGR